MKKITVLQIVSILFIFTNLSFGQNFEQIDKVPHDISYYRESNTTSPKVKVVYGRPSKNGKKVFGNQVAYGEIWRTGANEATEVKFYEDFVFGGVKVSKGTYVLYTIPNKNEWEVILSSNLDVFGAFQYDDLFDIARIEIPVSKAEELEAFSIAFKDTETSVEMVLGWDTTRVKIPLEFATKSQVAKL